MICRLSASSTCSFPSRTTATEAPHHLGGTLSAQYAHCLSHEGLVDKSMMQMLTALKTSLKQRIYGRIERKMPPGELGLKILMRIGLIVLGLFSAQLASASLTFLQELANLKIFASFGAPLLQRLFLVANYFWWQSPKPQLTIQPLDPLNPPIPPSGKRVPLKYI